VAVKEGEEEAAGEGLVEKRVGEKGKG